jgi:hypothetical protein
MSDFNEEVPKYRKRKKSSKSSSKNKSNHKHEYVDCLFKLKDFNRLSRGSYCIICGKVANSWDISFNNDNLLTRYPDLEVIELNSFLQRNIRG